MKPIRVLPPILSALLRIILVAAFLALVQIPLAQIHEAEANQVDPELLEADQAFRVKARWSDARTIEVNFLIADGYYMYRDRFVFTINGAPVKLAKSRFPGGLMKQDPTFGRVVTYRNSVRILLPVALPDKVTDAPETVEVGTTSQGCADIGVCYPPLHQRLRLVRGSVVDVGPEGISETTGFSRPQGALSDLLKKGR